MEHRVGMHVVQQGGYGINKGGYFADHNTDHGKGCIVGTPYTDKGGSKIKTSYFGRLFQKVREPMHTGLF